MIYTIGHSNYTMEAFLLVLASAPQPVDILLDVRSHPTSKWEQFRSAAMAKWVPRLAKARYEWQPNLGGWTADDMAWQGTMAVHGVNVSGYARGAFPKQLIAAARPERGPAWTNQGLYDYAWYTSLPKFQRAAWALVALGSTCNVAIMCAEVLWWKCHRSMVADWLVAHGSDAWHLQPKLTQHSKVIGDRLCRYPKAVQRAWGSKEWSREADVETKRGVKCVKTVSTRRARSSGARPRGKK